MFARINWCNRLLPFLNSTQLELATIGLLHCRQAVATVAATTTRREQNQIERLAWACRILYTLACLRTESYNIVRVFYNSYVIITQTRISDWLFQWMLSAFDKRKKDIKITVHFSIYSDSKYKYFTGTCILRGVANFRSKWIYPLQEYNNSSSSATELSGLLSHAFHTLFFCFKCANIQTIFGMRTTWYNLEFQFLLHMVLLCWNGRERQKKSK